MRSETFKTEQKRKIRISLITTALLACAVILVSCGNVDDSKEVEKFDASVTTAPTYVVTTAQKSESTAEETSAQTDTETSDSKTTNETTAKNTDKATSSEISRPTGNKTDSNTSKTGQTTQQSADTTAPQTDPNEKGKDKTPQDVQDPAPVLPRIDSRDALMQQLKEDRLRAAAKQIMEGVQAGQTNIAIGDGLLKTSEIDSMMPFISMLEAESYVTPLSYHYMYSGNYVTGLKIENYSKPHDRYLSEKKAVEDAVKKIVADANANCADQYEKVLYFHDYIVKNCVYDLDTGVDGASAYGCLIGGRAVCEGYAKAMMLLCNEAGIQCTLVIGEIERDNSKIGHMWDLINIGGAWTHVDVTWDDVVVNDDENLCCYSYFGLTDDEIVADHIIKPLGILSTFKAQSSAMNYHIKNGLYIKSESEIEAVMERAVENAVASSSQMVTLKCADGQTYAKLCEVISNSIYDHTKKATEKTGGKAVKSVTFFGQDGLNTAIIILRY